MVEGDSAPGNEGSGSTAPPNNHPPAQSRPPKSYHKTAFRLPTKLTFTKVTLALLLLFLLGFSLRSAGIMREPHLRPDGGTFWAQADEHSQVEYATRIANYDFVFETALAQPNASLKVIFSAFFLLINLLTPIPITAFLVLKASQYFSALVGSATIITTYYLGREVYGKRAGLIAASLFTVFMFHIRLSHYATPYAFTGFILSLFFLYLYRFCFKDMHEDAHIASYGPSAFLSSIKKGKVRVHRQLFLIGFFWMLAIASSHLSLFFAVTIITGFWMKYGIFHDIFVKKIIHKNKIKYFFNASFNAFIGFAVSSVIFYPYIYFLPSTVWRYFSVMLFEMAGGLYGLRATKGLGFFGLQLVSYTNLWWSLGTAIFVLLIISMVYLALRHEKRDILLVASVVLFAFYMGRKPLNLMRYTSVIYPLIAVMIGAGFDSALTWAKSHKLIKGIIYLMFIAVFLSGLVYSLAWLSLVTGPDTRQIAGEWMQENIPAGTTIAVGPGGTQPWMMPVVNYGNYRFGSDPEYIIIVESVYNQIYDYLYKDIYLDSDWGNRLPAPEVFAFYDQLFRGQLPYELHHVVSAPSPHVGPYVVDDSDAPYELWGTSLPDIQFYKRISQSATGEETPAEEQDLAGIEGSTRTASP